MIFVWCSGKFDIFILVGKFFNVWCFICSGGGGILLFVFFVFCQVIVGFYFQYVVDQWIVGKELIVISIVMVVMFLNSGVNCDVVVLFLINFFGDNVDYVVQCIGIIQ